MIVRISSCEPTPLCLAEALRSAAVGRRRLGEPYLYIYIYIYLGRHGNRQYVFMVSVVDNIQRFLMVSVVGFFVDSAAAGGSKTLEHIERFLVFLFFRTGFRRWFLYGFRRGRKTFLFMVSIVVSFVVSVVSRNGCLWFPPLFLLMVSGCYRTAAFSPMETVKNHQDVSVTN